MEILFNLRMIEGWPAYRMRKGWFNTIWTE